MLTIHFLGKYLMMKYPIKGGTVEGEALILDNLIHSINNCSTPTTQLLAEAQEALTLWQGQLKATGGALAAEKSYWYLIEVI